MIRLRGGRWRNFFEFGAGGAHSGQGGDKSAPQPPANLFRPPKTTFRRWMRKGGGLKEKKPGPLRGAVGDRAAPFFTIWRPQNFRRGICFFSSLGPPSQLGQLSCLSLAKTQRGRAKKGRRPEDKKTPRRKQKKSNFSGSGVKASGGTPGVCPIRKTVRAGGGSVCGGGPAGLCLCSSGVRSTGGLAGGGGGDPRGKFPGIFRAGPHPISRSNQTAEKIL